MPDGWLTGCTGKTGFESYTRAKRVVNRKRGRDDEEGREIYRCTHCRKWHLTTKNPKFHKTKGRKNGREPYRAY